MELRDEIRRVIVFEPWEDGDRVLETLTQAATTTAVEIALVLAATPQSEALSLALPDGIRTRLSLIKTGPPGLSTLIGAASARHPRHDLAVIAAAATLGHGWLDALVAAARSDDAISMATIAWAGRPEGSSPELPEGPKATTVPAAANDHTRFKDTQAAILLPDPAGTLIRAETLELVGRLEPTLTHPFAALAHIAARAREAGRYCILADSPAVRSQAGEVGRCPADQHEQLLRLHPWLDDALGSEASLDPGPLRHALLRTASERRPISVTVDARSLGAGVGGTQTSVASLLLALAASEAVSLRALVADDLAPDTQATFADAGIEVVGYEEAAAGQLPRTDIVHRPQQVFTPSDLRLMELVGERIVISQMDLIAYRAPSYHNSVDSWRSYRRTTRLALATADQVIFFSDHTQRDAVSEELVPVGRGRVVGIGVTSAEMKEVGERPSGLPDGGELLLVLGTDYAHKNRPFAIRLVDELIRRHGWDGTLVLAGPHVPHGSSAVAEAELLDARPELRSRVIDLGSVTEAEKRWLLRMATALVSPSTYEGFGLAPLEAGAAGCACIYAACTSLREIIDPAAATITPWDPAASADRALALMRPGPARERHLSLLGEAVDRYAWERVIPKVIGAYEAAIDAPYRPARTRSQEQLEREQLIVALAARADALDERCRELDAHRRALDERVTALDRSYHELLARVEDGMPLIDSRGPLLTPAQQRGLMRVAARPWLKRPILGGFGTLGSLGAGGRRTPPSDGNTANRAP